MNLRDIPTERLKNQSISVKGFSTPRELVGWFGAMQAQDYYAAQWAIGLRLAQASDQGVEEAFDRGEILRTHVMRPTWHFVAPEDIRWLLALTAPRVQRVNGHYYRVSGLDKQIFKRSSAVLEKALQGGKALTRGELDRALQAAGIPTQNLGLSYTLMQAELDGVICSGPRRGKQITYMLLEERVPKARVLDRDEALATLSLRYFSSHGPAQVQDFSWWSGLTTTEAKRGLEMNRGRLTSEEVEGKTYWLCPETEHAKGRGGRSCLVPGFDEYFVAYRDRSAVLDAKYAKHLNMGGGMVNGAAVVDGQMIGGWKRTLEKGGVTVTVKLFQPIPDVRRRELAAEVERYGKFLGLPADRVRCVGL